MKRFEKFKDFNKALKQFEKTIEETFLGNPETTGFPIIDGPLNPEGYFNAKTKIVWVLKEGYDNTGRAKQNSIQYSDLLENGKYWSYDDFLKYEVKPTWHPIVYCSYAILNNEWNYNELPSLKNKVEMGECLHQISIVNLNKYAASKGQITSMSELKGIFVEKGSEILKAQLELLEPDIVIFGYTFEMAKSVLNFQNKENEIKGKENTITGIYVIENTIYLDCYHPAAFVSKETYCNEIIQTSLNFINNRNLFKPK